MPRASRVFCRGFVWHITHRCHQKKFLLKFAHDRRRWRHWLFEARRRYRLCVLNYIATSMQLIAGRTAQEYNRRKKRKGAFWEDRYHATAVQADHHLIRCLNYIDLNMVRADVVCHPRGWEISGFHEIQSPRQRKGIIDHKTLCELVGISTIERLVHAHNDWVADALKKSQRDPVWTESVAVGDEYFLANFKTQLGPKSMHRQIRFADDVKCLNEDEIPYAPLSGSK